MDRLAGEYFRACQEPIAGSVRDWIARELAGKEYERLREYLGLIDRNTVGQSVGKYYQFSVAWAAIRRIVESDLRESRLVDLSPPRSLMIHLSANAQVDESGRLTLSPNDYLRPLDGAQVDRIRECSICGMIFWARRRDQPCCSKVHANALRVRRSREAYPKRYKYRRYLRAKE